MKILKINPDSITDDTIDLVTDYLKRGKVIAYPADTVYGLGCLATEERAIMRVYEIKRIGSPRPLIVLVDSLAMLERYVHINREQEEYVKKIWPGPVTCIFKSNNNLPSVLMGENNSLAVRLPKNDFLIKIINRAEKPLVSTSLNLDGRPILTDLSGIRDYLESCLPDLAVDAGILEVRKPSKIVDIRGGVEKVLRE